MDTPELDSNSPWRRLNQIISTVQLEEGASSEAVNRAAVKAKDGGGTNLWVKEIMHKAWYWARLVQYNPSDDEPFRVKYKHDGVVEDLTVDQVRRMVYKDSA